MPEDIVLPESSEEETRQDEQFELLKNKGEEKKKISLRKIVTGSLVGIGIIGSIVGFNYLKHKPELKDQAANYEGRIEEIDEDLEKTKGDLTKKVEEYISLEQRAEKILKENLKYERALKRAEEEKNQIIAQYMGSELKGSYDKKIANNLFDCIVIPGDEDFSYFKVEVKKTSKLQVTPENKALAVAAEDILSRVVEAGIMKEEEIKNIMENGEGVEYKFHNGEAIIRIKKESTVYQNYLTPDARKGLEEIVFDE